MIKWIQSTPEKKPRSGKGLTYPLFTKGVLWVYVAEPTEKEIDALSSDLKIPRRYLNVYKREHRSQRYSLNPLCFTFVDYSLSKEGEIRKTNILFFVDKTHVVSVFERPVESYESSFERMKDCFANGKASVMNLLFEILDEDIEENYDVLQVTEEKIVELEKEVSVGKVKSVAKVIELRRLLNNMSKAFWGSSRITFLAKKGIAPVPMSNNEMRMMEDLHDGFIHQLDIISNQKEMLTDTITIYQTSISNRLADISNRINTSIRSLTWVMLFLTGITLVLTIPNTVATFFGIPTLPLTKDDSFFVLAVMALSLFAPLMWFIMYWRRVLKKTELSGIAPE